MKAYIIFIIAIMMYLLLILAIIVLVIASVGFYDFFNNQTVAVIIGFGTVIVGYLAWKKQQQSELVSKYFEKLIEVTMTIFFEDETYISEAEKAGQTIAMMNQEYKRPKRYKTLQGKQETYMMLLEKYNDKRPDELKKILDEYKRSFDPMVEDCMYNGYDKIENDYRELFEKTREAVLSLVKAN